MHQRNFDSLRCIILGLQKEVIGSGLENTFKNHEKEHSGHDENNFFFYSTFYFTIFFNPLFFAFLQQFTVSENLKVAGNSAGRRRILTTLQWLVFLTRRKKGNIMLPVCLLSAFWPQTPTVQATLYQRPDCWRRFLVLLVIDIIKPPGTYFSNCCTFLVHLQSVKIFLRQTLHARCDVQHVSFNKRKNRFMLDFI